MNKSLGIALFAWFAIASLAHAYSSPGTPSGYVNDFAGVLSSEEKQILEAELAAFTASTTNEIAVATVRTIGDDYIEHYAAKLFEEWKIGTEKNDNGVLLLVAVDDRQLRIEVGYGLEGALPDSVADRIIRNEMVPLLKEERYGDAVRAGVAGIVKATQGEYVAESSLKDFPADAFMPLLIFGLIALQWFLAILARTKSWWLGGILGALVGMGLSTFFGWWLVFGALLTLGLSIFGLFFDYVVSSTYRHSKKNNIDPPWWAGGSTSSGGWGSGGGGFGGFGGGSSGGGGASGRW